MSTLNRPDVPPVGIVGAGPVGLSLAARLASLGIPSMLLEADSHLRKQGSKACLIQGDVLEVLDKFGCAEQIHAEGVTWHIARTYVRDKEIRPPCTRSGSASAHSSTSRNTASNRQC